MERNITANPNKLRVVFGEVIVFPVWVIFFLLLVGFCVTHMLLYVSTTIVHQCIHKAKCNCLCNYGLTQILCNADNILTSRTLLVDMLLN